MATAYIQFTSRLKATSQEGILAEAQQIAVSATDKTDIKTYVDSKVGAVAGSVYRPKGSVTAAQLKALASAAVGDVYNVTDALTLGSKTYPAGTNVACLKAFSSAVTPDETYWDALAGFVDLSPYAKATDLSSAKSDLQSKIDAANSNIATNTSSISTINSKLSGIAAGAQVNVIETVKVNGSALAVSSKAVNIDLSEYAKTSALATTNQAVTELKTTVDGISTSLDDIYTKDEVDSAITAAKYTLPVATTNSLGGVAISGTSSKDNLPSNYAKINIGGTNQIYVPAVSTSASGAMTPALFNKLNNIAESAQVNVIETVKVNGTALTPSSKAVNIDLSDYAKTSALSTTNQAVTELKSTVDGIATALDDVYTKSEVDSCFVPVATYNALAARVTALENLLKLV